MWLQLTTVLYILVSLAMVALILMQRGAGAQAGSGFGGGASATVFGARGASNFLSKSTKWLAILFFTISMGMAIYASRGAREGAGAPAAADLGVMGQPVPAAPAAQVPSAQVPAAQVPATQAPATPALPVAAPNDGGQAAPATPAEPATQSPQSPAR